MEHDQFITGDAIKTLADLPDQSLDALITDPPYPNQAGLFPETICDGYAGIYLAAKKVKNYVVFFWSPRRPAPVPPPFWYHVATHVWAKPDAKSNTAYEHIIVWSKDYKRMRSKVWSVPILDYRTLSDWQPHPTQKPVKLLRYLVDLYTKEGGTVLDPFAGSGTTAIACLQLKRHYLLIEKDPTYADVAKKRLEQKALREYNDESTTASETHPDNRTIPVGNPNAPTDKIPSSPQTSRKLAPARAKR